MVGHSQRLDLRQGQQMVMTPQLQQSLKMLQLSSLDLSEYIESELQNNPLLERADRSESGRLENETDNADYDQGKNDASEIEKATGSTDDLDVLSASVQTDFPEQDSLVLDTNFQESWDSGDAGIEKEASYKEAESSTLRIEGRGGRDGGASSSGDNYIDQMAVEKPTLQSHLMDQAVVDFTDPADIMIASYLIDLLDVRGYLPEDMSSVCEALGCDQDLLDKVIAGLQKCDPCGVFARTLEECLRLQLSDKNRLDPAMDLLIDNLDLLAKGEWKRLQKICGVGQDDLDEMCAEIRELNPRPVSVFTDEVAPAVQPDVFLRRGDDNEWQLELNSEVLPRVLVNRTYYAEVKSQARDEVEKNYLIEQFSSANWLLKALNQRAETILKVATEIVTQQNEFFEKGIYFLKPLVLADIAQALGIHESTVGRVTSNKYMATSRGLYELKFFFSSSVHSASGDGDISSKTVKYIIEELVNNESPKAILSDDKLAEILKGRGVDVARRTVAKYREALKIPSSVERRQQKRLKT